MSQSTFYNTDYLLSHKYRLIIFIKLIALKNSYKSLIKFKYHLNYFWQLSNSKNIVS